MVKRLTLALMLALVAFSAASVAWADPDSTDSGLNIQAP